MKRSDMYTFASSFDGVKNITSKSHKDSLKQALMAEISMSHAGYRKSERISSFLHSFFLYMKNIKVAGVTAAVAAIAVLGSVFAPNVLAYSAVYSGLDTVSTLSAEEVKNTYNMDIADFENSLMAAKKSWDLRTVSKDEAVKILANSIMTMGKTIVDEHMTNSDSGAILVDIETGVTNVKTVDVQLQDKTNISSFQDVKDSEVSKVDIANGTVSKSDVAMKIDAPETNNEALDPRVVKFVTYTNESGKKVLLGLDNDNLPIIMSVGE